MSDDHADRVRNHWYWRPGWSVGRRFYTWHITFDGQDEVAAMADRYRPVIDTADWLDAIPNQWLHVTMQGCGFIDEVDQQDIDRIVAGARTRCADLTPLHLQIGAPHVDPESIQIAVQPAPQVATLRTAIRDAIADVWGPDGVPERAEPFTPHMSLAYTNRDAEVGTFAARLDAVPRQQVNAHIRSCQLIVLHRDNRMYEWEIYADVPIG